MRFCDFEKSLNDYLWHISIKKELKIRGRLDEKEALPSIAAVDHSRIDVA
jgi:hypothetical protein